MHGITAEPRGLTIYPGTSDHGVELLGRSGLTSDLLTWFSETL